MAGGLAGTNVRAKGGPRPSWLRYALHPLRRARRSRVGMRVDWTSVGRLSHVSTSGRSRTYIQDRTLVDDSSNVRRFAENSPPSEEALRREKFACALSLRSGRGEDAVDQASGCVVLRDYCWRVAVFN